jgi:hypothetical protein
VPNQLTAEDYQLVDLATKHECYSHRHWPREVLRAIVSAEVIPPSCEQRSAAPRFRRRLRDIRLRLGLRRLKTRPSSGEDLAATA